jgi:uncharacterized protein
MRRRPVRILIGTALGLLLLVLFGRALARLYTELLWFQQLGYADVYRTRLVAGLGVRFIASLLGGGLVFASLWFVIRQLGPVHLRRRYGNLEFAEQIPHGAVIGGIGALSLFTGLWLSGMIFTPAGTLGVMAWLRHAPWGVTEPMFGNDVAFYVFTLPVLRRVLDFVLVLVLWSGVLAGAGYLLVGAVRLRERRVETEEGARLHLAVLGAALIALLALRYWLGRYDLLLRGGGFTGVIGYTDAHARLPARTVVTLLGLALGGAVLFGARRRTLLPPAAAGGALLLAILAGAWVYPSVVQKVHVEPNQLMRETPYIRWHMEFTRIAYDLDRIRRAQLAFSGEAFGGWSELEPMLARLPLWDREPLRAAFNQTEARRGYYHFHDVDYGRYGPPDDSRQVAIAVREFRRDGLPPAAQTWQTLHLNPDHVRGIGAVVTPAATSRADPDLWVGEIDPVQRDPAAPAELEIVEPSVYFGETMTDYIVLGAATGAGIEPATVRSDHTGVPLNSFLRVLAFALRFGDQNLLFATELTAESRLVFRRGVRDRVSHLAPFLVWDNDPFPVIHDGRIVWVIDGYSATSSFPLAASYVLEGVGRLRYARNSVKATVDAVTGATTFYAYDAEDPILRSYMRVFPGLVRRADEMPASLSRHQRYPPLMLRMQADMLKTFHLERAEPFYAGQETWELPDERTAGQTVTRTYRPLQMMMPLPGERRHEFVALFPFIARQRETMTALLVARNDPPHYGELLLFDLPRDQQVRGPSLIHSLVQQDPVIASQLALWRQSGDVNFGQLRIVPMEPGILYVQPLFLSAHGNPTPQIQAVIVSDGARVRMAPTLRAAVDALDGAGNGNGESRPAVRRGAGTESWAREALNLLQEAERRLQRGDWSGFGVVWDELQRLLRGAADGGGPPP